MVKKEEEKCIKLLEKKDQVDNVQPTQKHEDPLSKRQPPSLQTVRPIAPVVSRSSVLLRPRLAVATQVIPGVPVHPSLQNRPNRLVNTPTSDPVLPSPTNSSFSSYSPLLVSPQYAPSGSGSSSSGQPPSPGASDHTMTSPSTSATPSLWPLPLVRIDNRPSMSGIESSQLPGEYTLNNGYLDVSQPGNPRLVRGFSVYPTYPSYPTHGNHIYSIPESLQETLINRDVKEEEKEFDTNEWLNLDYITEQERNHPN